MSDLRLSKTLSISIALPPDRVYAYTSNPENLPHWVTSFVKSVRRTDTGWVIDTPEGPMGWQFTPSNPFGVLDHVVTLPSGEAFQNPMRVIPNGDGSEVMFTLLRAPDMSDERFAQDQAMIERDLGTLKRVLEQEG